MPKGRTIYTEISTSKKLGALPSDSARMFYTWVLIHLDCEGRIEADAEIIKGRVFPKIKTMTYKKIKKMIKELVLGKLIIHFCVETEGIEETFLQYRKFLIKASLKKAEASSKIPFYKSQDAEIIEYTDKQLATSSRPGRKQLAHGIGIGSGIGNGIGLKQRVLDEYPLKFEEFWKLYPRKKEKKAAYISWKGLPKKDRDEIIKATALYAFECQHAKTEEQFIKYPKTFINKDRWKDYSKMSEDDLRKLLEKGKFVIHTNW